MAERTKIGKVQTLFALGVSGFLVSTAPAQAGDATSGLGAFSPSSVSSPTPEMPAAQWSEVIDSADEA